ncbi:MAG: N-acetylmuramoyl-L-alanine amidase [Lysobacteraceae bacterium]|jgi:N-acetylmuramoyl-L-alanine amidase|nr:N-acetylmuramoyl-L-alanine amidase [Xanthomonadaceae bacterium]MCZ8318188.1 N-acetylmuramoyl-L-alanine amidase [Silanimonas sp.]
MSAPLLAPGARFRPVPYRERLTPRDPGTIDLVVVHCTETPTLDEARAFGERVRYDEVGTGACGHYYLDRDGALEAYVEPERIAHHVRGWNPRSIGIEIVNTGRHPHWYDSRHQAMDEPYTEAQIVALRTLLAHLRDRFPALRWIAGHEDLDTARVPASDDPSATVWRKRDPGPMFPWARVLADCGLARLVPEPGPATHHGE